MEIILIVLVGLFFIMLIGHGLWVSLAWLLRQLSGPEPPENLPRPGRCQGCAKPLQRWHVVCPACGLRVGSVAAAELAELDVVGRHLQRFRDQGVLDLTSWRRLHDHLEEQGALLRKRGAPASTKPAATDTVEITEAELVPAGPVQELEQLLATCQDVRNLTLGNRLRAVGHYRQLSDPERRSLSAPTQWNVARLLHRLGFADEAVQAYRQLLHDHPQQPAYGEMALEAGRLTLPRDAIQGRWFLERALTAQLPLEKKQEAEQLLQGEPATAEEILEVVPVAEAAPAVLPFLPADLAAVGILPEPALPHEPATPVPAAPPPAAIPPRPPRRSLTELLAAFMEERNILWGEIVGGLLMVGCSIALVVYLWKTYKDFPYFPFFIFTGITAGLFGIGLYALHRLKLDFTGRSLLIIAALLVPLNFLYLAGLARDSVKVLQIGSEVLTLALFAGLVGLASRALVPNGVGYLVAAVVGTSASQLLTARLIHDQAAGWLFLLLGMVPVACQGIGTAALIWADSKETPLQRRPALSFLEFLGLATFALGVALGFLAYQGGDIGPALRSEALLIALAGVPILAGGLFVQRGLADEEPLAGLRTGATVVALAGMLVMLAGLALAWPRPDLVLAVAALDFAVLTAFAFRGQLPVAHAAALTCLAVAWWTAQHWLRGHLTAASETWSLSRTVAVQGGVGLTLLTAVLATSAEGLLRRGLRPHALFYAAGSGVIALISLALVMSQGLDAAAPAALVCGLYGFGCLAANLRWQQPWLTYAGLVLVLGMTLWGLQWLLPPLGPTWAAVLAGEALLLGGLATALGRAGGVSPPSLEAPPEADALRSPELADTFRPPLRQASEALAYLAMLAGVMTGIESGWSWAQAVTGGCLFVLYLLLTVAENLPYLARMAAWLAVGTGVALVGWMNTVQADVLDAEFRILLAAAAISSGLALTAVVVARRGRGETADWPATLAASWLETAGIVLRMVPALLVLVAVVAQQLPAGLLGYTFCWLAATAFLSAWGYQQPVLSWVGSGLLLLACAAGLRVFRPDQSLWSLASAALLVHATAMLLISLGLKTRWLGARILEIREQVLHLYALPLGGTALVTSGLALPLILIGPEPLARQALLLAWLAGLWLVLAWVERWPALFSAFQAVLSGAVLYAIAAAVQQQEWVHGTMELLAHPWSLQAYGLGLAGLGLVWAGVRVGLRSQAALTDFLEPPWPRVDRVLLGLVVLSQVALAIMGLVPGFMAELIGAALPRSVESWLAASHAGFAWMLLAATAAALVASLWDRRQTDAVLGLVLLALTVPMLTASRLAADQAVTPALAWGLGVLFLIASAPVWLRAQLAPLAAKIGLAGRAQPETARYVRRLLVGGAMVPLLALTLVLAWWSFLHGPPARPVEGSFFGRIGWLATLVVPPILATLGLVGYALREQLSGYAAAGSLVASITLMGAYALAILDADLALGVRWVRILQLGACGFAAWGLAWLPVRRAAAAPWTGQPPGQALGAVPLLFGLLCLVGALLPAGAWFVVFSAVPMLAPAAVEASSWLGWVALALFAAFYLEQVWRQTRSLLPLAAGAFGLTALLLLAGNVERLWPGWGQRALMLGWATYALAWPLGMAVRSRQADAEPLSPGWQQAAALWTALAGLLAVGLGLKNAYFPAEQPWAAATFALAGAAGAVTALQRRQEAWAFVSGFGFNLAASVLVWHVQAPQVSWVTLLQANVLATAVAALLWLAVRERFYATLEISLRRSPLLTLQVALVLLGNAALLAGPLLWLVLRAGEAFPQEIFSVGNLWGLAGLVLALAAYFWYASWIIRETRGHALVAFGLALGVWAAVAHWAWFAGGWGPFYVLIGTWAATGLGSLGLGWFGPRLAALGRPADALTRLFPPPLVRDWVNVIGLLLVLLALRAWPEPARPFWSAAGVLTAAVLATGLALWQRSAIHVITAGLLADLAGLLIWLDRGPPTASSLVSVNPLGLALTAVFWSGVELVLQARGQSGLQRGGGWTYRHIAVSIALVILAGLVGHGIADSLLTASTFTVDALTWAAWAAIALALLVGLWDEDARWTLAGLYAAGLTGIGLGLLAGRLAPADLGWMGTLLLAGYVLAAGAVRQFHGQLTGLWQALRWPQRPGGWPAAWFSTAQTVLGGLVVVLSVWLAIGFPTAWERLGGPLAAALVLPASVWLAATDRRRHATLVLGIVVLTAFGWALLSLDDRSLWLHRTVLLMSSLAVMTLAYGVGLARLLPGDGDWARCGRASGPVIGLAATAVLLLVIVQEGLLYDLATKRTTMAGPAVLVVAVTLVVLIGTGICFAVMPGRDPFGLSERGRMLYVYGSEVLLFLLFVHVRLNRPELFGQLGVKYWTLIVMGIAFLGVGLSEYFQRRGWRVLAEPLQYTGLFLPLLPLLAFWARLPGGLVDQVGQQAPGLHPLVGYLDERKMPRNFGNYAILWFMLGMLYSFLAFSRRSHRWALLAALAANCGWWALLYEHRDLGIDFLRHPQLWLIPLAVIVLVAEYLNRDRLPPAQAATLRYLGLLGVYLSSTADMFIVGLGQSLVFPLVLTGLSLLGVLGGMLLRVRAFLFLGVAFLALVIISMIWHAAMNLHHYWVWWITGIVLGGAIIALFALFEKRRNEVLQLVDQLKHWD